MARTKTRARRMRRLLKVLCTVRSPYGERGEIVEVDVTDARVKHYLSNGVLKEV